MRNILKYIVPGFLALLLMSCDKNLADLNINKTSATSIDPVFILNNAIISTSFPTGTVIFDMGVVQQIVTPNGGVLAGANFNQDNRAPVGQIWGPYNQNVIRNTRDIIERVKNTPERSNLMNMTRILQAYVFTLLTDAYGDIPYSEAGMGFYQQKFFPKYDLQQDIYKDLIKEVTEASAALNAAGKIESGEILFEGNIAQWKKFGYSLLLRLGMRLSKADAGLAKTTVQAALTGGVITENADDARMRHEDNYRQPIGNMLNSTEAANFYIPNTFINALKSTNDPRLSSIAIRYIGAGSGPAQVPAVGSTDPDDQIGMPMGNDNGTILAAVAADGLVSYYEYSQIDRRRMASATSPNFFITAAQNHLLLAEAAQREWLTGGKTAAEYYEAGIRLHMEQMEMHHPASAIAPSAIQQYIDDHPYNEATGLEQIGTQYWIASFLNGPEAWANFRRTGYPALPPNPYPAGDIPAGTFIRRITYPVSELSANTDNVNAAIGIQGADKMDTRIWWDK